MASTTCDRCSCWATVDAFGVATCKACGAVRAGEGGAWSEPTTPCAAIGDETIVSVALDDDAPVEDCWEGFVAANATGEDGPHEAGAFLDAVALALLATGVYEGDGGAQPRCTVRLVERVRPDGMDPAACADCERSHGPGARCRCAADDDGSEGSAACPCGCAGVLSAHDERGWGPWSCPACGEDSDRDRGERCSLCEEG